MSQEGPHPEGTYELAMIHYAAGQLLRLGYSADEVLCLVVRMLKDDSDSALKPCPFCGGDAVHCKHTVESRMGMGDETQEWVACTNCGCEQDSVEQWNSRFEVPFFLLES